MTIEYAKQNIRVTAVCPAFIHTPLVDMACPPKSRRSLR